MSNSTGSNATARPTDSGLFGVSSADSKIIVSALVNVALLAILFLFFLFAKKRYPVIYENRCKDESVERPLPGPVGWLRSIFTYNDYFVLKHRGLDCVIYLAFLRCLVYVTVPITFLCCVVLMPVFWSGRSGLSGLASITISNLQPGDPLSWAPFVMCIVFSVWTMIVFYRLYISVTDYRIKFRSLKRVENYVALVREIPAYVKAKQLGEHFDELFPNQIVSIQVCLTPGKLPKLFSERKKAVLQVEKFWALFYETGEHRRRPKVHPKVCTKSLLCSRWCCKRDSLVDAIDHWEGEVARLDREIQRHQRKPRLGAGVAFLTFKTIRSAQTCWQVVVHAGKFGSGQVFPSPWITEAPMGVESTRFNNIGISARSRFFRFVLVDVLNVILVAVFYFPIALLVAISSTEPIADFPLIGDLYVNSNTPLFGFIRGFLPSIAVALCNFAMLGLLRLIVSLVGFLDNASIHRSVVGRFYLFQIFGVLIGVTVGGTIVSVYNAILVNPSQALDLIAASIPTQSSFFVNYLLLLGLAQNIFFLSRPWQAPLSWFRRKFLCHSKREFRALDGPFLWGFEQAIWPLLVFLLGITYSCVAPIVMIPTSFYFLSAYVRAKYEFLYVVTVAHPSNGIIFPTLFACIVWSLVVFQLVTLILLFLYRFFLSAILLLVITITLIFYVIVQLQFTDISKYGTLSQIPEEEDVIPPADKYVQKFMLPPKLMPENQHPEARPEPESKSTTTEWVKRAEPSLRAPLVVNTGASGLGTLPRASRLMPERYQRPVSMDLKEKKHNLLMDKGKKEKRSSLQLDLKKWRRRHVSPEVFEEKQKRDEEEREAEEAAKLSDREETLQRQRTLTTFFVVNRNATQESWEAPDWGGRRSTHANLGRNRASGGAGPPAVRKSRARRETVFDREDNLSSGQIEPNEAKVTFKGNEIKMKAGATVRVGGVKAKVPPREQLLDMERVESVPDILLKDKDEDEDDDSPAAKPLDDPNDLNDLKDLSVFQIKVPSIVDSNNNNNNNNDEEEMSVVVEEEGSGSWRRQSRIPGRVVMGQLRRSDKGRLGSPRAQSPLSPRTQSPLNVTQHDMVSIPSSRTASPLTVLRVPHADIKTGSNSPQRTESPLTLLNVPQHSDSDFDVVVERRDSFEDNDSEILSFGAIGREFLQNSLNYK